MITDDGTPTVLSVNIQKVFSAFGGYLAVNIVSKSGHAGPATLSSVSSPSLASSSSCVSGSGDSPQAFIINNIKRKL